MYSFGDDYRVSKGITIHLLYEAQSIVLLPALLAKDPPLYWVGHPASNSPSASCAASISPTKSDGGDPADCICNIS
jgi:hypothetical protein